MPRLGRVGELDRYALDCEGHLEGAQARNVAAQDIDWTGVWRPPSLTLTNFHATLANGQIDLHGALDVATRALKAAISSDADPRQLAPCLPQEVAERLAQAAWNQPPRLTAGVELVLPVWTNRQPDWRAEVLPTLRAQGQLQAPKGGTFKGFSVAGLQSHVSYSNQCLQLPDLLIVRPEGRLSASVAHDSLAKQLRCHLVSSFDLGALRPLLGPDERDGLDLFTFTRPPAIEAEIRGPPGDPKQLGIQAHVTLTNFTFRGESATRFEAGVRYSNQVLRLETARLRRGAQRLEADSLVADFNVQKVFLTNGFSTTEPMVVARAIGPPTARAIQPFQFITTPTVRVHGIIPMHGEADADLYFRVDAGQFHWSRFNVPRFAVDVHWAGLRLFLSSVETDFYGGKAQGSAAFYFDPTHPGADYRFSFSTTNTLLQALMAGVFSRTNRLEGRVKGDLVVTSANTENWRRTQGYGALATARRPDLGNPDLRRVQPRPRRPGPRPGQRPSQRRRRRLRHHQRRHPSRQPRNPFAPRPPRLPWQRGPRGPG